MVTWVACQLIESFNARTMDAVVDGTVSCATTIIVDEWVGCAKCEADKQKDMHTQTVRASTAAVRQESKR